MPAAVATAAANRQRATRPSASASPGRRRPSLRLSRRSSSHEPAAEPPAKPAAPIPRPPTTWRSRGNISATPTPAETAIRAKAILAGVRVSPRAKKVRGEDACRTRRGETESVGRQDQPDRGHLPLVESPALEDRRHCLAVEDVPPVTGISQKSTFPTACSARLRTAVMPDARSLDSSGKLGRGDRKAEQGNGEQYRVCA